MQRHHYYAPVVPHLHPLPPPPPHDSQVAMHLFTLGAVVFWRNQAHSLPACCALNPKPCRKSPAARPSQEQLFSTVAAHCFTTEKAFLFEPSETALSRTLRRSLINAG